MAIPSPISLGRTSQSASSLKFLSKETGKKTLEISKLLNIGIERKNNLWFGTKLFRKRRIGIENRIALRDQFRIPLLVGKPRGPRIAVLTDTSTSIADRLLKFVGYFSAGWILSNLPTWISIGEQFSTRILSVGSILSNYGDETLRALNGIGNVLQSVLQNILVFDFTDSSYLVRSSLNDLKLELDTLGKGLEDAFNVLFQPFKNVPPIGSIQPDEPDKIPPPGPGGGKFSGSGYDKAAQIAKRLQKDLGLTDYQSSAVAGNLLQENTTLQPDILEGGKKGLLTEAMRKGTGYGWAQWTDSGRQKKLYDLAKSMGVDPSKQPLTDEINYAMLVSELPSYDSGGRFRNSKNIEEASNWLLRQYFKPQDKGPREQNERISDSKKVLKTINSSALSTPSSQQPPITGQRRLQIGDKFTKSLGKDVSLITISDVVGSPREGGRTHGGIDITAPLGTYIALRVDCEVVAQGTYGDYGLLIDVWIASLGIQLRMTHLSSVLIKSGKIPAGTSFARVGQTGRATGPHIHLEYDTKKGMRGGGARNDDPTNYAAKLDGYVRLLLLTKNPNKGQFSPAPVTPLVPGTPSISMESGEEVEMDYNNYFSGFVDGIQQERKGRKIVIIDDRGSSINQQIINSGGGSDIQIEIPQSVLLNNFIKNKLLLDLNYL